MQNRLITDRSGSRRESEDREESRVEEGVDRNHATVGDLEHVDLERFERPRGAGGPVHGQRRAAIGRDLDDPVAAAFDL
jgi:hypothetical protein